jgi:glycosyltransferase involved in cell wall biosynthesis/GT2 family glycosyltransferase
MFSVAIPVYNHQKYLVDCVISSMDSRAVSEVLLVDDGSTDGSRSLLPYLGTLSKKIRVLGGANENRGAHARLNQLVSEAANDWVAVLNSDDMFVAQRFEVVTRMMAASSAELFFGDLVLIDDEGRRLGFRDAVWGNEHAWPSHWNVAEMLERGEWLKLSSIQNVAATTTNMIFSKRLHAEVGGFKEFRYCHDWDFVLRASAAKRVMYLPTMLSRYRLHRGNTIKEAAARVRDDVRRMFWYLREDLADLSSDGIRACLSMNRYLGSVCSQTIAVVVPDRFTLTVLQDLVAEDDLPIVFVRSIGELPDNAAYVYRPDEDTCDRLTRNDLLSIVLALAVRGYDGLVAVTGAGDSQNVRSAVVMRRMAMEHWQDGNVRLCRLRFEAGDLGVLSGTSKVDRLRDSRAEKPWSDEFAVVRRSPLLDPDQRPVVFICPAFLAVGGVERLILDTISLLKERYRFVIVTTEPLQRAQGSLQTAVQEHALVFDLPELAREEDYIRAIAILRDWYGPVIVWMCNGAPWQAEHALELREVFKDIPIIEHTAYDDKAGWINAYDKPGILQSDRFVAINSKIKSVMTSRYKIEDEKIDLIYHGTDLRRLRASVDSACTMSRKNEILGSPDSKRVFGMIARLTAQKRPFDLIELARKFPEEVFVWVGLGELETEFRGAAAAVENMHYLEARKDLGPIYQMLDGLVVTSEFEGLPLVVLEALAMGVPVLSSDVGAIHDVLSRYGSGLVYAPPGDLAALFTAFSEFRTKLNVLTKAAVDNAEKVSVDFSSKRMANEYATCFERARKEKLAARRFV